MPLRHRVTLLVLITLFLPQFGLGAAPDSTDWPQWGYDATRAGMTPMPLPAAEALHLHWVRELGPPRRAWPAQNDDFDKLEFDLSYAPVVMGDTLFVGSMVADRVTAYAIDTGEERWRYYADGPIRLAPAAWNGNLYCVSDDGHLYCLNAATGQRNWKFRAVPSERLLLGNERVISMWPARGAPVVQDGIVYFAAGIWPFQGIFIYALNAQTGEIIWANTGDGTNWQVQPHGGADAFAGLAPQGYLAIAGDRLIVSGGRTAPALFDRHTGTLLHINLRAKGAPGRPSGGYRVQTDGEYYYNHGERYRLSDGGGRSHPHHLRNEALSGLVEKISDGLDGKVFTSLAARGRIFVVTVSGTLYCFGAGERHPQRYKHSPETPALSDDRAGQRAASLLAQSRARAGYALFLGVADGALLEQVAVRSDLHIVGIEADAEKIRTLRRRFDDAGLYGTRISLRQGDPLEVEYPPYISSLIVVPTPATGGGGAQARLRQKVYSLLHPYHGRAFLGTGEDEFFLLARENGLPGTGSWTHQYADSANTVYSDDDRVRVPLGILWFGGPSNENILPRHGHGPVPHAVAGVMVLPGAETLSGRCIYTGRELWERSFPGLGHPFTVLELEQRWRQGGSVFLHDRNGLGAHYIGSPYVSMPDGIYVRYRAQVFKLDPQTGAVRKQFNLAGDPNDRPTADWGHISVWQDLLIVTVDPHVFRADESGGRFASMADIKGRDWSATSSQTLLVFHRHTGELKWRRTAEVGFRHNAIVTAGGTMFVIDGLSPEAVALRQRRGEQLGRPAIVALEAHSGEEKWRIDSDVFGTWLGYSEAHDVLIEAGRRGGLRDLPDEPRDRIKAYRGKDGSVLWERALAYTGPIALHGSTLLTAIYWHDSGNPYKMSLAQQGQQLHLLTGAEVLREDPITGRPVPWTYWRTYGCNTANVSKHLVLFRSGAAGFADLEHDGGTGTLGGFRAGCTANLIAAGGVLLAPDYTRTCSCAYQNQTSVGLIHMPGIDVWTVNRRTDRAAGPVRRIGINLNAPGNRRADDGTLWVHYPPNDSAQGTLVPEIRISAAPEKIRWFRNHSLLVDSAEGYGWVAASGGEGIDSIRIENLDRALYTVKLHFVEPGTCSAGQRVFDVLVQGRRVLAEFDIAEAAGKPNRAVVRTYEVEVEGALDIAFRRRSPSAPPVLSGIELMIDDFTERSGLVFQ